MARRPFDPNAAFRTALEHFEAGRYIRAKAGLDELHRLLPREPAIARALGAACSELGLHDEAVAHFLQVVETAPEPLDYFNLGKALQLAGRYPEAVRIHETGLKHAPADRQLLLGCASALAQCGRRDEAIAAYETLLRAPPEFPEALFNFAEVLVQADQAERAVEVYRRALKAEPDNLTTLSGLVRAQLLACNWEGFDAACDRLLRGVPQATHLDPFTLLTIADDPGLHLAAARTLTRGISNPAPVKVAYAPGGRLRIAYLSADFRDHATSYLLAGVLEAHDRERFEIHAFNLGTPDTSTIRKRIEAAVSSFHEIGGLSPDKAMTQIKAVAPHILVDLMGHTRGASLPLMRSRLAPVEVNFLGYPGTTALPALDYIVLDPVVAMPDVAAALTEAPVILPGCYQPNDPARPRPEAVPPRESLGLPAQGFVYVCFNNAGKVTPGVFDAWMTILQAVGSSVLWLYLPDETARANLRREAERRGVAAGRLVFAGKLPLEQHLARYLAASLFLDTFPYGAHTTGSDALWMGCPVLTRAGRSFPSRVAASLLTQSCLPELITQTTEDYIARAIAIGRAPERAAALRAHLEAGRATNPLFDAATFARNLERAYSEMWARHKRGARPRILDLTAQ